MARIRSMKPEFRTSLTVTSWPRDIRLYFSLLWGYLDDHGYGVYDAHLIKADTFPRDEDITPAVIEEWTDVLIASGSVCRFTVNGREFVHCPSWTKHQKPQHPSNFKYVRCPKNHDETDSGESHDAFGTPSGDPHETLMSPSRGRHESPTTQNRKPQASTLMSPSRGFHDASGDPHDILTPEQVAGSREQGAAARARTRAHAREDPPPRQPNGRDTDNAILAITDATDATESEARQIIGTVMNRDDPPRNLPGFLRRLAADGDLAHILTRLRADNRAANPATHRYHDPGNTGICQHPATNGQPCGLRDIHSRHRFVGTATVELRTLQPANTDT